MQFHCNLNLHHLLKTVSGFGTVLHICAQRSSSLLLLVGRRPALGVWAELERIITEGRDTTPDELLSAVMTAVLKDVGVTPDKLGDTIVLLMISIISPVGNVLQPGAGAVMARIAQFLSGFPETVPVYTVNRQCSSGLQALFNVAGGIRNGFYDLGLACGVESMSLRSVGNPGDLSSRLMDSEKARECLIPMGAAQAQKQGLFVQEIVPVTTKFVEENGTERTITVTKDDGIRPGTTMEGLAKLRAAFKDNGSTTAGNASQVSDGAAAVLMGRRYAVEALGLPVIGILRGGAVVGVPPDVMGIGPAYAIPAALERAGLTVNDVDVFEINEAFASQAVYCVEKLGIPMEKVNPNGGAIALGHPLGCTGARQVVTLLNELKRRGKRGIGVVSMCIGTGMGAAAVFEYPGP
ncbi:3-ketoacyl-CoA thiolase A, peroxisomal [Bagarius yarrelli]|uniref:3-ketoacyl-CoA thiolase A, peroxisomal n=1 Tax=Bagarius yarrelli TaxID=175774 RepID=A0A556TWH9_BAGYA|nr:3-ketoacyl-CoA thiolase A, peroxisomal [Bagarius yarrelli]